ncbi:MAG TPA: alpha/beta fold hydrolase [Thermoanaerobaculia bacterium]|nr:alpha/beta fold hydrolase [Thermoanaerobaculia bacterium]
MRRIGATALLLFSCLAATTSCLAANNLERTTCGWREWLGFKLWLRAATQLDPGIDPPGAVPYLVTAMDGRKLHGYRLKAAGDNVGRVVLVIQGNAMTAATIADAFWPFAQAGYDVVIVDFRGYGKSEGIPRAKALLADNRQILVGLRQRYHNVYVYGLSLGAILAANLLDLDLDAYVLDSLPATLKSYGCPAAFDPINHLPANCSNLLVVSGGQDPIIKPAASEPLLARASSCGATVVRRVQWSHPFMDYATDQRVSSALAFFRQIEAGEK